MVKLVLVAQKPPPALDSLPSDPSFAGLCCRPLKMRLPHVWVVSAAEGLTSALSVVKSSFPATRDLEGILTSLRLRFAAPHEVLSSVVNTQRRSRDFGPSAKYKTGGTVLLPAVKSQSRIEYGNSLMAKASVKFVLDSRVSGLAWTNTKFVLLVCNYVMMMKDLSPLTPPHFDNIAEVCVWECFCLSPRVSTPGISKTLLSL